MVWFCKAPVRTIQSEFSLLIANCFTCTVMRICVFIKTTDADTGSKEKLYSDQLTHLYNEKRPLSCIACCSRHYLVRYHRHTLLQYCTPLCRYHRNLVPVSSGAVVMEDPSLPDLLQFGPCRCMACQAPSTWNETVCDNYKKLRHDLKSLLKSLA